MGVLCVAGLAATGVLKARASSPDSLPRMTPAALVSAVQKSKVSGFAGTVVSQLSLGLPELPDVGDLGDVSSFGALLTGSHTLQVWFGGVDKQRIALLGPTDEVDLFRDGRDLWQWTSDDHTAVHLQLRSRTAPAAAATPTASLPVPTSASSFSPSTFGQRLLSRLDPSTDVTVEADQTVAGRAAYDLVLTPQTTETKIGSVHIAVDGQTKMPLGVEIYARGESDPAVDIAFTSVRFAVQPDRTFTFTPPHGAIIRDAQRATPTASAAPATTAPAPPAAVQAAPMAPMASAEAVPGARRPQLTGSNWTTVVELPAGSGVGRRLADSTLLQKLTPVTGHWGSGRLLDSALLSVLVTKDGRIYAGAVDPSELYAAAGTK